MSMVSTAPPNEVIDSFSLEDEPEQVVDRMMSDETVEKWAHSRSKTKVKSKVGVPPALPVEGLEPWKENVLVWEFEGAFALSFCNALTMALRRNPCERRIVLSGCVGAAGHDGCISHCCDLEVSFCFLLTVPVRWNDV